MNICGGCDEVEEEDKSEMSFTQETVVMKEEPLSVADSSQLKDMTIEKLLNKKVPPLSSHKKSIEDTFKEFVGKTHTSERSNCEKYFQKFKESVQAEVDYMRSSSAKKFNFIANSFKNIEFEKDGWYQGQADGSVPEGVGFMCEKLKDNVFRLSCGIFTGEKRMPTGMCFYIKSNGCWYFGQMDGGIEKAGILVTKMPVSGRFRKFEGFFEKGLPSGPKCKISYYDEQGFDYYEGPVYNGKPHGKGKIYWDNGEESLEANFNQGIAHGSGNYFVKRDYGKTYLTWWENGVVDPRGLPNPPSKEMKIPQ